MASLYLNPELEPADAEIGSRVSVGGDEARHAVSVARVRIGERIAIGDGSGFVVRGAVIEASAAVLAIEVDEVRHDPEPEPPLWLAQALAKGDRDELAIEMLTEAGIDEVVPWQASRSIARWSADRVERGLGRWRSSVREAAKQSRRLRIPEVAAPVSTQTLAGRVASADLALILHEEATEPIGALRVPAAGNVLIVVGPEGGISPDELEVLTSAGGRLVSLGDTVLRTSTAGVVAFAALRLR